MVTTTLVVENPRGLHARSATAIVNLGRQFNAAVTFEKTGQIANGNNIMELLLLEASKGTELILRCDGEDALAASIALTELFAESFGEKDA
ncbi:MAG: HPr family phosphocarrier protein [Gammaproteobacteria bacterium]|jgi:phosphocarrier protein HPr|tara:strand:+ start:2329 stop:2601 length:273 start_codon:yes stop_codon:yes gene_type:complete